MVRRLTMLLLAVTVTLAGITVCPRGVLSCSIAWKAAHDCCGNRTALRSADCCCRGSLQRASSPLGTTDRADPVPVKVLATGPLGAFVARAGAHLLATGLEQCDRGLSPPDTLITLHASLLL